MISNWHTWEILTNWWGRFTMYVRWIPLFDKVYYDHLPSLKLAVRTWQMDEWKTTSFPSGEAYFQGRTLSLWSSFLCHEPSLTHPEIHPGETSPPKTTTWRSGLFLGFKSFVGLESRRRDNMGNFRMFLLVACFFCGNLCRGLKSYAVFLATL